ncbi:hypothetical protein BC829DRAFT_416488 [Chytridium lagenaria]|nr:hypothetical protein BC829DRAFT_416488 [Chytridium lagenaria]
MRSLLIWGEGHDGADALKLSSPKKDLINTPSYRHRQINFQLEAKLQTMRISTLIAVIAAVTASTAIPCFQRSYLASLATQGYTLTNYNGVTHPSQATTSPSLWRHLGITGDGTYNLAQTNIVDLLEAKSLKWKTYQENYPGGCATASSYSSGLYVRKHNPFMSFTNIAKNAARMMDMILRGYASNWLKTFLTGKLGLRLLRTPSSLSLLTNPSPTWRQPCLRRSPRCWYQRRSLKDSTFYNHYSWLATIEDNYSLGNLGRKDVSAVKIPLISGDALLELPSPPSSLPSHYLNHCCANGDRCSSCTTSVVPPVVTTTTPTPTITPCAHSICATGVALKAACDSCVSKIIAADSYCGTTKWDATCVGQVKSVCDSPPAPKSLHTKSPSRNDEHRHDSSLHIVYMPSIYKEIKYGKVFDNIQKGFW